MLDVWPKLRHLVASVMLAMLAVGAFASAAQACRDASGDAHGVAQHVVPPDAQAAADTALSTDGDNPASHDSSGCACACHAVSSGLAPSDPPHLIPPRLAANLPRFAELPPPGTRPDGPMRPPRHL